MVAKIVGWLATESGFPLDQMGFPKDGHILVRAAGSIRRCTTTVRDVDLVIVGWTPRIAGATKDIVFVSGGDLRQVWDVNGVQVDLYITTPQSFGATLLYATGPKAFNLRMRAKAKDRGWKLSRWGLWDGDELLEGESEKAIFDKLGMPYLKPENR